MNLFKNNVLFSAFSIVNFCDNGIVKLIRAFLIPYFELVMRLAFAEQWTSRDIKKGLGTYPRFTSIIQIISDINLPCFTCSC